MIHDGCFNVILWRVLLNTKLKLASTYSIFYIIGTSILIFIVGAMIDLIRKIFEKYTVDKIVELKIWEKIYSKNKGEKDERI